MFLQFFRRKHINEAPGKGEVWDIKGETWIGGEHVPHKEELLHFTQITCRTMLLQKSSQQQGLDFQIMVSRDAPQKSKP